MRKIQSFLICCLLVLFAGSALSQDGKEPPYGIKYETKTLKRTLQGCDTTSSNCPEFDLTYVWMTEGKNKDLFNGYAKNVILNDIFRMEDTKYNTIEEMADGFIDEFVKFQKEYPDVPPVGWYLDASYQNLNELSQVVSFELGYEMYTGGAHPVHYLTYYNYDYNTGKPVRLKDIFVHGFEKKLNQLVDKAFRKENDLEPNQPLTDADMFEDHIEYNDNFLLTPQGIYFFYNIYEIKPYAAGTTELLVPYSDLIDLIDENGLGIY